MIHISVSVCTMLLHTHISIGATVRSNAGFGQGTGEIILDQVGCIGSETSLFDCPANPIGTNDCSHFEDVGVICLCENLINHMCTSSEQNLLMTPLNVNPVYCHHHGLRRDVKNEWLGCYWDLVEWPYFGTWQSFLD